MHSPSDDCNCEPFNVDRCEYRWLADRVIALLNPPDGEDAEVSICMTAVEAITEYVETIPCTCTKAAVDRDDWPCRRCQTLGRIADRPEIR